MNNESTLQAVAQDVKTAAKILMAIRNSDEMRRTKQREYSLLTRSLQMISSMIAATIKRHAN